MPEQPSALSQRLFILHSAVLVTLLLLVVSIWPKSISFLTANFFHCPILDTFFIGYTYVGDGWFAILMVILFFIIRNRKLGFKLFLSFLLSGIIAQVLKHLFHAPRPKAFFADQTYAHFIEGITRSGLTSFPSGHTTTAFAIAATLSFNCKKPFIPYLTFWMATLVGYSRIYLGQHFVEDVLAGMITGIITALLIEQIFTRYTQKLKTGKSLARSIHEQTAIEL